MRNLTVKRAKSFVGCITTLKLYIEDENFIDTKINGVPCRKLGTLKNGEEKSFVIDGTSRKLFVIADKLSKNISNDYVTIPDSEEDVYFSGKVKYSPLTGNPFLFDGNTTDEEVLKNRKAVKKKSLVVMLIAVIIGFIVGIFSGFNSADQSAFESKAKVFTHESGISLTLSEAFKETSYESFTVCYDSSDVAVFVLKESIEEYPDLKELDLESYAKIVHEANEHDDSVEIIKEDNYCKFEYEFYNEEINETCLYFTYMYETDSAFWLVQFATSKENADEYPNTIPAWAKMVTFE